MENFIEKYKWYLLGGAAVVAVAYVYLTGGSSGTAAAPGSPADIQAAEQYQSALDAANSQASQNATGLQAQQESDAASIALAKISASTSANYYSMYGNIASQQINAQQQSSALHDTLSAQVAENTNATSVSLENISATNQTAQLQSVANALVTEAGFQAQTSQKAITASCGFFCRIFG